MARGSYQSEVPPSRVNIKYVKYTGDAQKEMELPLKLLLLGDYTQREDDTPLEDRKRINIDKNNFASVMREQKLGLNFTVDNVMGGDEALNVNLNIEKLNDFKPESIAEQVPELQVLLEIRNLLQDLKGRVVNNAQFRRELETILKDRPKMEAIKQYLDEIAPLPQADKDDEQA